jgi:putative ABC transport system permease protein
MFKHYLKISIRSLLKDKSYATINVFGLTIAMVCFIFIALYVKFELSYDEHHQNIDKIYRVLNNEIEFESEAKDVYIASPMPLFNRMKNDFPEVEEITTLATKEATLGKSEELFMANGLFSDENLFDIFDIELLKGQDKKALKNKNSILLTQTTANRIFGKELAIGKTLSFNNKNELTVKGIIADAPENQHFKYDFIVSRELYPNFKRDENDWFSCEQAGYVLLKDAQDYRELEAKLIKYEKVLKPAYKNAGFSFYPKFSLQPVKDIHLYSNLDDEFEANSNINYIYFFSFIAIIILLLASMNYVNLAISRYSEKTKEVGVHKVLGANKSNLIFKYVNESLVLSVLSFLVAIILVILMLPLFNQFLGKEIVFSFIKDGRFLMIMLLMALGIGVISGIYPAIFLAKVNLVTSLKGNVWQFKGKQFSLKNVLVIGQFIVAIGLIISSFVVYKQYNFLTKKELGYTKENVLYMPYKQKGLMKKEDRIRNELLKHPNITQVSISSQLPINIRNNGPVENWAGNYQKKAMNFYRSYVDYDFINLVDMKMVEGRSFSKNYATDFKEAYIINEAAKEKLGWQTAIGKEFFRGKIIGVVKDFHFQSLGSKIQPLFMTMRKGEDTYRGNIIVKTNNADFTTTKLFVEQTIKSILPTEYIEVKSLENTYNYLYETESKLGYVFNVFAFIAILIASMGLFGLVSFHIVKRKKEIGIRKILGSSSINILWILSKEFVKLIAIALLIAIPIAYYTMSNWLQNYAYRIELNVSIFLLVGAIVLLLSVLTILMKAYKVTISNPINSLRTE